MRSFLLIAAVTIAATIGCTYKSAGSQSSTVGSTAAQSSPEPATQTQEKVPCTLTLAGAPTIIGLRLGMSRDEVLTLFPGSKDDPDVQRYLTRPPDQFGDAELIIRPPKYQPKDEPVRIKQIGLGLLDGKVYEMNIGFNGPAYPHVDKFVEALLPEMNFPALNQWEPYVGMDNQMKTLRCTDFEVEVFAGGKGGNLNYVKLRDLLAEKKLNERHAKAAAQATPLPNR